MTRKEEIVQAANNYKNQFPDGFINEHVYVDGAEWADETMIKKACSGIEKLLSGYIIRNFNFGDSYDIDKLIEDFKDYMKGE
jgi:hypothetical protein